MGTQHSSKLLQKDFFHVDHADTGLYLEADSRQRAESGQGLNIKSTQAAVKVLKNCFRAMRYVRLFLIELLIGGTCTHTEVHMCCIA